MEATVNQVFEQFNTILKIQNRQQDAAVRRSQTIVNQLNKAGLRLIAGNIFGSYSRNTVIRPLQTVDIDLLIVLDSHKHKRWRNSNGALDAISVMQNRLSHCYDDAIPGTHGILIPFQEFRLNVVPGFEWPSGGYLIPNKGFSRWILANPDSFADRLAGLNAWQSGKIVPLIRMVKAWNREIGSRLEPLHIETMVCRYFDSRMKSIAPTETYAGLLAAFFVALPGYLSGHVMDLDFEQRVDTYLDEKRSRARREEMVEYARCAAELASAAHNELCREGDSLAIATWRQLFGRAFPA